MNPVFVIADTCPRCGARRSFSPRYTLDAWVDERQGDSAWIGIDCDCPQLTEMEIRLVPMCRICQVEPETSLDGLCDGCREASRWERAHRRPRRQR